MDQRRFDHLARLLGAAGSRREAMAALLSAALLALPVGDLLAKGRGQRGRNHGQTNDRRRDDGRAGSVQAEGKGKGKGQSKKKGKGKGKGKGKDRPGTPKDPCAETPIAPGQTFTNCNLSGRDLRDADLHGATFANSDLSDADLSGANLQGSQFRESKLIRAKLEGADFTNATVVETDFTEADFTDTTLLAASFDGGTMQGATFNQTVMPDGTIDNGTGGDGGNGNGGDGGAGGDGGCAATCRPPQLLSAGCKCVCLDGLLPCPLCPGVGIGGNSGAGNGGAGGSSGSGGSSSSCSPCVSCPEGQALRASDCACTDCQLPERDVCNGLCRNLLTDTRHCGVCGQQCPPGHNCVDGLCECPTGGALCDNGSCVACQNGFVLDPRACRCVCPGGTSYCEPCDGSGSGSGTGGAGNSGNGGSCASVCVSCPSGKVPEQPGCACVDCPTSTHGVCNGICRNLQTDNRHCGSCQRQCPNGSLCVAGACECQAGKERCNTGECRSCPAGFELNPAACACQCPAGAVLCHPGGNGGTGGSGGNNGNGGNAGDEGGVGVGAGAGADGAGGAGSGTGGTGTSGTGGASVCVACAAGQVVDAACACVDCPAATHGVCDGACVNLQANRNHCGQCGLACGPGAPCVDGVCDCPAGSETCANGACAVCAAPLVLDLDACECSCAGGGAPCTPSTCGGGDGGDGGNGGNGGNGGDSGGDGPIICATQCVEVCAAGQALSNQCACVDCPEATHGVCGGFCRNLQTNDQHCGACGTACGSGKHCTGGDCVCNSGLPPCATGECRNCHPTFVVDTAACQCVCPAGTESCTPTDCGGDDSGSGGDGGDSGGNGGCWPKCVADCAAGQIRDPAACGCVAA